METARITDSSQTNYHTQRSDQPTNRFTQLFNPLFERQDYQTSPPQTTFGNLANSSLSLLPATKLPPNIVLSTNLTILPPQNQASDLTNREQPTNRLTQIINRIFKYYQAWISQNVCANSRFVSLMMLANGEPLLLRQLASSRELQMQAIQAPFRSYASQLMTLVTTWRNLDGKEQDWVSGGRPFGEERRVIPLSFYGKAVAAETCFPVITTVAIVESIVYKSIALLGKFFGRIHIRNDYEQLFQSSSFTILWSLADMFRFNANTNVYTHEALARLAAKGMGYDFFRPIDTADLYTTFGPHFSGPRSRNEGNNNNNNTPPVQMPARDEELFRAVAEFNKSTDGIIEQGSVFLQNLLKNDKSETIENYQEMSIEAFKFVLFKTVLQLAVSDKSAPIPDFLRNETKSEISKLRADEDFQKEVAAGCISQYISMTPGGYDNIVELPAFLEKITKAHGLEYQNKIFFDCFAAYLETLSKS